MYNWNKTIEDQTKLEYIPPGIIDLLPKINCSGMCMTLVKDSHTCSSSCKK